MKCQMQTASTGLLHQLTGLQVNLLAERVRPIWPKSAYFFSLSAHKSAHVQGRICTFTGGGGGGPGVPVTSLSEIIF